MFRRPKLRSPSKTTAGRGRSFSRRRSRTRRGSSPSRARPSRSLKRTRGRGFASMCGIQSCGRARPPHSIRSRCVFQMKTAVSSTRRRRPSGSVPFPSTPCTGCGSTGRRQSSAARASITTTASSARRNFTMLQSGAFASSRRRASTPCASPTTPVRRRS